MEPAQAATELKAVALTLVLTESVAVFVTALQLPATTTA